MTLASGGLVADNRPRATVVDTSRPVHRSPSAAGSALQQAARGSQR